jgi:hypothetical protein
MIPHHFWLVAWSRHSSAANENCDQAGDQQVGQPEFIPEPGAYGLNISPDIGEDVGENEKDQRETPQEHSGDQILWSWINLANAVKEDAQVNEDDWKEQNSQDQGHVLLPGRISNHDRR